MVTEGFDPQIFLQAIVGEFDNKVRREQVARMLQEQIGRDQPFSESYIYNVMRGNQEASPKGELYQALLSVFEYQRGGHPIAGAYEPVVVMAIPGYVEVGSLILNPSRRCRYIRCNTPFVPKTPNQVYCCAECRKKDR